MVSRTSLSAWFALKPSSVVVAGALLLTAAPSFAVSVARGDIDRSGRVSTADAILALRSSIGLVPLNNDQRLVADVNGDGKVNTVDAGLILRRSVGLVADFGMVELAPAQSTVSAYVKNNETVFEWPKTGKSLVYAEFTQGDKTATLAAKIEADGDKERFALNKQVTRTISETQYGNDYALFRDFVPGQPVKVVVSVAATAEGPFVRVDETQIKPVVHQYDPGIASQFEPEITLQNPFPDTAKVGETITLSGQALSQYSDGSAQFGLRADAYVTQPSGLPVKLACESSSAFDPGTHFGPRINPGNDFSLKFKVESEGVYIVEINNYLGEASLNRPIYVGEGVPLVPGPLDTYRIIRQDETVEPAKLRAEWLESINRDRTRYGLQPVVLDETLNAAAQAHTDDMAAQDYFGHISLDGSDPVARALKAGVSQSLLVGENLAPGGSVEEMEAGLMASGIHRANILNPSWRRVGIGVTRHSSGYLYGAQEFGVDAGEYELATDFFGGLTLDAAFPTAFTAGASVTVTGQVDASATRVIVFFQNAATGQQVLFPATLSGGRFTSSVTFTPAQAGLYQAGVAVNGKPSKVAYVIVN